MTGKALSRSCCPWLRLLALAVFTSWLALNAQEFRATLLGTITDPTGAVVPGVKIAILNEESGVKLTAESSGQGTYTIPYVAPGEYQLVVEHPGFKTFEQAGIELKVSDRQRIDISLVAGAITERIEIKAESPLVETVSANRGQVVGQQSHRTTHTQPQP